VVEEDWSLRLGFVQRGSYGESGELVMTLVQIGKSITLGRDDTHFFYSVNYQRLHTASFLFC
jgi:protein-arginine kinase